MKTLKKNHLIGFFGYIRLGLHMYVYRHIKFHSDGDRLQVHYVYSSFNGLFPFTFSYLVLLRRTTRGNEIELII